IFQWRRAWFLPDNELQSLLSSSIVPSLEGVAGIFNNLITTFPVASLAALFLLLNWNGHRTVLTHALKRRFGFSGWLLLLFIALCAMAALLKPLLYFFLPFSGRYMDKLDMFRIALGMDWLALLFE